MKAKRYSDTVDVITDDDDILHYNLNYWLHCSELLKIVGKNVFDLIALNDRKWIDVNSLEVQE